MSAPLRTVEVFTSPWEAHVSRALLESEGVPATLVNEHHVGVNWSISLALGGVRVCVPPEFETEALAVLARRGAGEYERALSASVPVEPGACPGCGGRGFKRVPSWRHVLLALLTLGVASVIFPPRENLACAACGRVVDR